MKLCMVAPEFPPVWGGVGTYTFELVRHLPKKVEIHVLTPRRECFGKHRASVNDGNFLGSLGGNVHLHYISSAHDSFMYNAKFQYACMREIPKIVKENKIEVVHSHQAHMPDLLLTFSKLPADMVTTVHTTIKSQRMGTSVSRQKLGTLESSEKATYYLYPFLRAAEELYVRRKRKYITPSFWMAKWLRVNFPAASNVHVIPNCVELPKSVHSDEMDELLDSKIPKDLSSRRMILYSGRLLAMKGIDVLIDSMHEVLSQTGKNELLFVFAGPGDNSRYIKKLDRMHLQSQYLFTGPLPREAIIKLIKKSEVVIVPSYSENCPYSVLETMACGKPVVASDVGGIPEIVSDGVDGLLVEPGSPRSLAKSVTSLLLDDSLRASMGQRAKLKVESKFSWKAHIAKYTKIYSAR
jgi:glycosyltransferase involved in cell wall biosynthesis